VCVCSSTIELEVSPSGLKQRRSPKTTRGRRSTARMENTSGPRWWRQQSRTQLSFFFFNFKKIIKWVLVIYWPFNGCLVTPDTTYGQFAISTSTTTSNQSLRRRSDTLCATSQPPHLHWSAHFCFLWIVYHVRVDNWVKMFFFFF